jgi:hypothetical protein
MNVYRVTYGDNSTSVHYYESEESLRLDMADSWKRTCVTVKRVELLRRGVVPYDLSSGTCES